MINAIARIMVTLSDFCILITSSFLKYSTHGAIEKLENTIKNDPRMNGFGILNLFEAKTKSVAV